MAVSGLFSTPWQYRTLEKSRKKTYLWNRHSKIIRNQWKEI